MRILNQTAIRDHALKVAKQIKGEKFTRVSESFFIEIETDIETFIRSLAAKYPEKIHPNIVADSSVCFITGDALERLRDAMDAAIARLVQRRVEQHPSVGSTLQGKDLS